MNPLGVGPATVPVLQVCLTWQVALCLLFKGCDEKCLVTSIPE